MISFSCLHSNMYIKTCQYIHDFVFYLRDMFFAENLFLDICGNQCIMKATGNLFQMGESVRGPVWICRRLMCRGESGLLKAELGFSCCRRIPMRRRAAFAFRDFYQWQKLTEIQKYSLQIQGRSDFVICVRRKEHARIEICYSRIAESEEHERI